jgi:glycosyltransferase involved in cell wall biosynthesis
VSQPPDFSLVIPVFNEGANVPALFDALAQHVPPTAEVLICYDFPADNTLPAIELIPPEKRPAQLRLIHNTLGRGVRFAIDAGMKAATSPVVIVTMADLSDDFTQLPDMARRIRGGATVVCPSRYMKGGKQIGGPAFKSFLSRMAGFTLFHLARLPTHDPTNSFKAYDAAFLRRTPIESPAGFVLALELTVKAHAQKLKIEEFPTTWRDRTAGESRFNLRKWLPLYLRWYFYAFWH